MNAKTLDAGIEARIAAAAVLSPLEVTARTMIARHQLTTEWSQADAALRMVFSNQWGHSLSVSRIVALANALFDIAGFTAENLQPYLTKMVSSKLLRSRVISGVRHYELAFA